MSCQDYNFSKALPWGSRKCLSKAYPLHFMDHPHSRVIANSMSRMLNHFHIRSINSFVDIYLSPSYFLYPFSLRLCPTEYLRLSKGNFQMGSGKPQKIHCTEYVVDTGTRPLSIYNHLLPSKVEEKQLYIHSPIRSIAEFMWRRH